MRNLIIMVSTIALLSGCQTMHTKESMQSKTNLELCKMSNKNFFTHSKELAKSELSNRGIDWRGFECSNAINQEKEAKKD